MSIKGESRLLFLPVFDHLTCASALSAVVIFNFAQTFILHKRTRPTFLGSLTLVEGKAPRKRVMEAFLEHALTDTDFHTRTACTLPPTLTFVMYSVANPAQTLQCQT